MRTTLIIGLFLIIQTVLGQETLVTLKPAGESFTGSLSYEFECTYTRDGDKVISEKSKKTSMLCLGAYNTQLNCIYASDIQLNLEQVNGDDEVFMGVKVPLHGKTGVTEELEFVYKLNGVWELKDVTKAKVYFSGTTNVIQGPNTIMIKHRLNTVSFYLNGLMICEWVDNNNDRVALYWKNIKMFTEKGQLAASNESLTGYYNINNPKITSDYINDSSFMYAESLGETGLFKISDRVRVYDESSRVYKLMDSCGRIFSEGYNNILPTKEGPWLIVYQNEEYGYIDYKGKLMLKPDYKGVSAELCSNESDDCILPGCYSVFGAASTLFYINPIDSKIYYPEEAIAISGQMKSELAIENSKALINTVLKIGAAMQTGREQEIMQTANVGGVEKFKKYRGNATYIQNNQWQEKECDTYVSTENFGRWVPMNIDVFDTGFLKVYFNLNQYELELLFEKLPAAGFTLVYIDNGWAGWKNGKVTLRLPNADTASFGGDCIFYLLE
jgi:hypothetical protein